MAQELWVGSAEPTWEGNSGQGWEAAQRPEGSVGANSVSERALSFQGVHAWFLSVSGSVPWNVFLSLRTYSSGNSLWFLFV